MVLYVLGVAVVSALFVGTCFCVIELLSEVRKIRKWLEGRDES